MTYTLDEYESEFFVTNVEGGWYSTVGLVCSEDLYCSEDIVVMDVEDNYGI